MGSSTTETTNAGNPMYDFMQAYAGMEQMNLSKDQWDFAKNMLGSYSASELPYREESLKYQTALLPTESAATQAALDESMRDIQANQPIKDALRQQQLQELNSSAPVADEFYKQALAGIDPNYEQVMGQATGDVTQAYANSDAQVRQSMANMGLNPESGAYGALATSRMASQAADTALARTAARETEKKNVEDTNWNRLASAMSARGRATGLPGTSDSSSGANGALSGVSTTSAAQTGTSLTNSANSALAGASNTWGSLSSRNSTSETEKSTDNTASALGSIGGTVAGALIASPKF